MLTIVEVNADRSLLTVEELRAAVGLATGDTSQDPKLTALGLRVSASITRACKVAAGGATPPTLRIEKVSDTYRLKSHQNSLLLSRRPISTVTSIVENGVTLADADYEIDPAAGIARKVSGDCHSVWPCGKIVISYTAGWATVPDDLKGLAAQLAGGYWLDEGIDPMEKSLSIPDVISVERWVDASADGILPREIMLGLERGGYVNVWIA